MKLPNPALPYRLLLATILVLVALATAALVTWPGWPWPAALAAALAAWFLIHTGAVLQWFVRAARVNRLAAAAGRPAVPMTLPLLARLVAVEARHSIRDLYWRMPWQANLAAPRRAGRGCRRRRGPG